MTLEKIDWKSVSKTAAYKKLKAGIWNRGFGTRQATTDMRGAITAIKMYAKDQEISFAEALDRVEELRNQSACSYYDNLHRAVKTRSRFHKSGNLPTMYGAKGSLHYKKAKFRELLRQQRNNSKRYNTKKERWATYRKRLAARKRYLDAKYKNI